MNSEWFGNDSPGLERFWHPVAFRREVVPGQPLRVELLGRHWVLLRTDHGILAYPDQCPHRRAPLSAGRLVDGELECPYHGWRFDTRGSCMRIPALPAGAKLPAAANLKPVFGVTEGNGLVWMAIEEPLEGVLDWPQWQTPGWDTWWLQRRASPVNGGLLTENFMDATHFAFVHQNTFGAASPSTGVDYSTREGWRLSAGFKQLTYQPGLGATAANVTSLLQGPFSLRMLIDSPAGSRAFTFFLQPVNALQTRLYLGVGCDDTHGDPVLIEAETDFNNRVYDEDLILLEQFAEPRLPLGLGAEISTSADANLVKYRRMLGEICRLTSNPVAS